MAEIAEIVEPLESQQACQRHTGISKTDGLVIDWPDTNKTHIRVRPTEECHVRIGGAALDPSEVRCFTDVVLTHGAIAGDDGLFAVGNYLRGLTSSAVGLILEAIDATHTRIVVTSGGPFQVETVNETTTGLAGGDTGDAAAVSAVGDNGDENDAVLIADELVYIRNPSPSTYPKIAFRASSADVDMDIIPKRP